MGSRLEITSTPAAALCQRPEALSRKVAFVSELDSRFSKAKCLPAHPRW